MPAQKRHTTKYPGVSYIIGTAVATEKPDKIYYIDYRRDGKRIQEKAGRQSEGMTPARASTRRADKIKGRIKSNKERREAEKAAKLKEDNRWTIERLWKEYKAGRKPGKGLGTDISRYIKYLKEPFGEKEPYEIILLDVERVKRKLQRTKSPQTTKHVLNLLTWIVNFGVKGGLCPGFTFQMKKPEVNNEKTEDLTKAQLTKLLEVIAEDTHEQAGNMMLLALYSGMRRGEMFKLKWRHINFEKGFIALVDPKGGPDQRIPLNEMSRELLMRIKSGALYTGPKSAYVFPGRGGKMRTDMNYAPFTEIRKKAGLPKGFRQLHGLRHVYASMLANSGRVDLYTLQKLLTHKTPRMTQRYAHLRDAALKRAAAVACDEIGNMISEKEAEGELTTGPNGQAGTAKQPKKSQKD
jgi:integrase